MNLLKTTLVFVLVTGAFAPNAAIPADTPTQDAEKAGHRVGTFDSRAVAVAFFASEVFERQLQQLKKEHEKAEAAGDDRKARELAAQANARQKQAHRQGFGTAPVDDLLQHIKDELPALAKRADVDVIVSKWAITYSVPDAQLVDITDLIVEPFDPNERTKRTIRQLRLKPPIPPEEIEKHHDH